MTTNSEYPPHVELTEKLSEKEYRDAFVESRIRRGVPFQIRAIRETLGWSQDKLAELSGINAPNISRIENTRDTFLSFQTLLKIASAFDMAVIVKFAAFSELEDWAIRPISEMVPPDYQRDANERASERESTERAAIRPGAIRPLNQPIDLVSQFKQRLAGSRQTGDDPASAMFRRGPRSAKEKANGRGLGSEGGGSVLPSTG